MKFTVTFDATPPQYIESALERAGVEDEALTRIFNETLTTRLARIGLDIENVNTSLTR